MPTQEQFDAMHDSAFCDWWDAWFETKQANASYEEEVEVAEAVRTAAFENRWWR